MKQETLEEACKRVGKELDYSEFDYTSFKLGAKWQQERMYSEEEVYDILIHHTVELFKKEPITLENFLNKFKNK